MSEFTFIDGLMRRLAGEHAPNRALLVPPGDDCALVPSQGPYLFAADMLMEGVHFDLATASPDLVGRKALAVNLSDIAAMAGTPTSVTVCLALPQAGGLVLAERIMAGITGLARCHGVAIAGGDTNSWKGPLVVSVAVTGTVGSSNAVTRAGAQAGDGIFVTGALGGSLASGRHLTFSPRLLEARLLHERYGLRAMVDLSDGLASDLGHVLAASGVGATLCREAIPTHAEVRGAADPLARALTDGEDFELCFTVAPDVARRIEADRPLGVVPLTRIGEITAAPGLRWQDGTPIVVRGYAHPLA